MIDLFVLFLFLTRQGYNPYPDVQIHTIRRSERKGKQEGGDGEVEEEEEGKEREN